MLPRQFLEFLRDTPAGSRSSRASVGKRESVGQVSEGVPGPP